MEHDGNRPATRWIMAFDASCGSCRAVAAAVEESCGGKIEVKPLRHPEVAAWRAEALGEDPAWEPTLLRVGGDGVRAWTGRPMALRLARRLGPRDTFRLLRAFGARAEEAAPAANGLSRKGFLRLGTGLGVAAGIVFAGRTPAFAQETASAEIDAWMAANRGDLPDDYDTITAYPIRLRRAIHHELPAETRTALWTEHLTRYRETRGLTDAQTTVLDRAVALLERDAVLTLPEHRRDALIGDLRTDADAAFGRQETALIFTVLGPAAVAADAGAAALCSCSTESDYCDGEQVCRSDDNCDRTEDCGWWWSYICNGFCNWP